jgi:hypothetical protein
MQNLAQFPAEDWSVYTPEEITQGQRKNHSNRLEMVVVPDTQTWPVPADHLKIRASRFTRPQWY